MTVNLDNMHNDFQFLIDKSTKNLVANGYPIKPLSINQNDLNSLIAFAEGTPFIPTYSNGIKIEPFHAIPFRANDPWTYSLPTLDFPGDQVSLPQEFKDYFAYGTAQNIEESRVVFVGDSDHTNFKLKAKRYALIYDKIIKTGDILLQEGLPQNEEKKQEMMGKKFIVRGWEDPKTYDQCLEAIKNKKTDLQIIRDQRNDVLSPIINANLKEFPDAKIVVYCGSGHCAKQVTDSLVTKSYVCIFDRYVTGEYASQIKERMKKYYGV